MKHLILTISLIFGATAVSAEEMPCHVNGKPKDWFQGYQAEQIMLNDMPVIPLYFYVSQHLIKPWVVGLEGNVMDHHYSKYVKILKSETIASE